MKYSFANAKPVPFGKIDYWFRVNQCGCHKTDYKPNLRDKRKFNAELKRRAREKFSSISNLSYRSHRTS